MNTLELSSLLEWREWLTENHERVLEVWVVFDRKKPVFRYEESLEEALCFGWVDSLIKNIDTVSLFTGIDHVIREIAARGITIAVVSSNALRNIKKVLGSELSQLISIYECQTGLLGKAPRLRRALRQAGVAPDEALSFGDEIRDIDAARKAGIPCAAVTWGFADGSALARYKPDHLVTEVDQILKMIA